MQNLRQEVQNAQSERSKYWRASATGLDPATQNGLPSHLGESRHMKNLKIATLLIAALGACILAGCAPAAEKPAGDAAAPAGDTAAKAPETE